VTVTERVAPFSTPEVTEPLSGPLVARARAISERGEQLERQLTSELERIRAELRRLPRMPRAQGETRFEAQA
jgi:hypothetical protein